MFFSDSLAIAFCQQFRICLEMFKFVVPESNCCTLSQKNNRNLSKQSEYVTNRANVPILYQMCQFYTRCANFILPELQMCQFYTRCANFILDVPILYYCRCANFIPDVHISQTYIVASALVVTDSFFLVDIWLFFGTVYCTYLLYFRQKGNILGIDNYVQQLSLSDVKVCMVE